MLNLFILLNNLISFFTNSFKQTKIIQKTCKKIILWAPSIYITSIQQGGCLGVMLYVPLWNLAPITIIIILLLQSEKNKEN